MLNANRPNSWHHHHVVTTKNRPANMAKSVVLDIKGVSVNTQIITSSKPAADGLGVNVRQKIIAHPLTSQKIVTRQDVMLALMAHPKTKQIVLSPLLPLKKEVLTALIDPVTAAMKGIQTRQLPDPLTDDAKDEITNAITSAYGFFIRELGSMLSQNTISKIQALVLLREASNLKTAAIESLITRAITADLTKIQAIRAIRATVDDYSSVIEAESLVPQGITAQEILKATE